MERERETTLRTERLILRPTELDDAELLWPDISDPEISKYMAWEAHTDRSQTIEFLRAETARREADKGITWTIFRDDMCCGIVSLIALVRRHRALTYNKAELGYWLGRRYQRQGIMTEAVRRVMEFGFQELALHKICVSHFSGNDASERLIKGLGFRRVGEQVEEFRKNGVWYDHILFEILDWEFYRDDLSDT